MKGVVGIDEVGRGPLAGPVTVCAAYVEDEYAILKDLFDNVIRDSKKIKKSLRNNIYQTIRQNRYLNSRVEYAVFSRNAAYIDKHGITKAVEQCVRSCIRTLRKKGVIFEEVKCRLDAGLKIPYKLIKQESFVKGDEKFVEIALASIIAKESRDAYMRRLSKRHKGYAWDTNVGYGTHEHREAIRKTGITKHHRTTYLKGFKLFDKAE